MTFSKSFPRTLKGSNFPVWEEIFLSEEEEREAELNSKMENYELMKECIDDAKKIIEERGFKGYKEDILQVAIALFEKRASHSIYHKENKAKENFDKKFKEN